MLKKYLKFSSSQGFIYGEEGGDTTRPLRPGPGEDKYKMDDEEDRMTVNYQNRVTITRPLTRHKLN